MWKSVCIALCSVLAASSARAASGDLLVCAQHYKGDTARFHAEFADGPIIVPSGTVFQFGGHRFGTKTDPMDLEHVPEDNGDFIGASKAENDRRRGLNDTDASIRIGGQMPGVVTTSSVTLTPAQLCGTASAKAVVAMEGTWGTPTVMDSPDIYYMAIGRMMAGHYIPAGSSEQASSSFERAMGELELYAFVAGPLLEHQDIPVD